MTPDEIRRVFVKAREERKQQMLIGRHYPSRMHFTECDCGCCKQRRIDAAWARNCDWDASSPPPRNRA